MRDENSHFKKREASHLGSGADGATSDGHRQRLRHDQPDAEVIDLSSSHPEAPQENHPLQDFPFYLLRVRNIPAWANEGFLGFKFADAVTGPGMKWALVSNYMLDFPWLLSACPDLQTVPRLLIVHGEKGDRALAIHRAITEAGMLGRALTHAPPLPPYGTHHSKAFFVQYETGLRVIIHTANLLYCDANNKSQGVYMQDFPLKDGESPASSSFETDLLKYVAALKLAPALARETASMVSLHDFSAARAHLVASVPSAPGEHAGTVRAAAVYHVDFQVKCMTSIWPAFSLLQGPTYTPGAI